MRLALIAAMLLLLVGCASHLTMNKIQFVERGMATNSLSSMVEREPAIVFTVVDPEVGLEYHVQIFPMHTGTATVYYSIYSEGMIIPFPIAYPVSEKFVFLFCEDSLLFWGFLHEFARSDEQLIRRLAPLIMEGMERRKGHESG